MRQTTELNRKSMLKSRLLTRISRGWSLIPCAMVACLAMQSWSLIQGIGNEADAGLVVLRYPNPFAVHDFNVATAKAQNAPNSPALAGQPVSQSARKAIPGSGE